MRLSFKIEITVGNVDLYLFSFTMKNAFCKILHAEVKNVLC